MFTGVEDEEKDVAVEWTGDVIPTIREETECLEEGGRRRTKPNNLRFVHC